MMDTFTSNMFKYILLTITEVLNAGLFTLLEYSY